MILRGAIFLPKGNMTALTFVERRCEGRQWAESANRGTCTTEDAAQKAHEILRHCGEIQYLAFISGFNEELQNA